ncbi:ABC-F family ATP-binding cassette domain-containing protein [Paenibacillus marinisediminis]
MSRWMLEMRQLRISHADRLIVDIPETMTCYEGECIGIVGMNGAGKSSLLHVLAGTAESERGEVLLNGSSVLVKQWDDRSELHDHSLTNLSGGEWTKHKLHEALRSSPDILMLDEPTSHLDIEGMEELERLVLKHRGLVLIISHDRATLDQLCTKIWEVENGKLKVYSATRPGAYRAYQEEKERLFKERSRAYEQVEEERQRLTETLVDKREQARGMMKKPNTKSLNSKEIRIAKPHFSHKQAKMDRVAGSIQSRIEQLPKLERPYEEPVVRFDVALHEQVRSKVLLECEALGMAVSGGKSLTEPTSFRLRPGMRVAVTGPNGCGKSTLLRVLLDAAARSIAEGGAVSAVWPGEAGIEVNGSAKAAPRARLGYYDQQLQELVPERSAVENVKLASKYPEHLIRTALARLNLAGDMALKQVSLLSGGERVKVLLIRLLLSEANVLVLDEPTNYLDIHARERLEELLLDYPGTLLFVSHDRVFVEKIATHRLDMSGAKAVFGSIDTEAPLQKGSAERDQAQAASPISDIDRLSFELAWTALLAKLSQPGMSDEQKEELELQFRSMAKERAERFG